MVEIPVREAQERATLRYCANIENSEDGMAREGGTQPPNTSAFDAFMMRVKTHRRRAHRTRARLKYFRGEAVRR